jgi:hypothetical protein
MPRSDDRQTTEGLPPLGHNGGPPLDDLWSMTVKTAMRRSGFSRDTIYDLIAAGEVESFLQGSRRYLTGDSVRAYIARRAAEPLTIRRSPKPRHGRGVGPADQRDAKT